MQLSSNGRTVSQSFSIPTDTYFRLRAKSEATNQNLSRIITRALEAYLSDFSPEQPGE